MALQQVSDAQEILKKLILNCSEKVFIVGMPASGKSRLGKYISSMTNLSFIDLDIEIEKKLDIKVKDIFEIKGEKFFRKIETKTLKEIIENKSNFILATGGGTPCFNENMSIINNSECQYSLISKEKFYMKGYQEMTKDLYSVEPFHLTQNYQIYIKKE